MDAYINHRISYHLNKMCKKLQFSSINISPHPQVYIQLFHSSQINQSRHIGSYSM